MNFVPILTSKKLSFVFNQVHGKIQHDKGSYSSIYTNKSPTNNANSTLLTRSFLANLSLYFISIMYENPKGRGPMRVSLIFVNFSSVGGCGCVCNVAVA